LQKPAQSIERAFCFSAVRHGRVTIFAARLACQQLKHHMASRSIRDIDVFSHNRASWERQAAQHGEWSQPVSAEEIAAAREGHWQVRLTPSSLPAGWLDEVAGLRILCLASVAASRRPYWRRPAHSSPYSTLPICS